MAERIVKASHRSRQGRVPLCFSKAGDAMQFPSPFPPPPGAPDLPPPGPVYQELYLLFVFASLLSLALLALPEPWSHKIIRTLLKNVWPFSRVNSSKVVR